MRHGSVECYGDCILCGSVPPVGKLVAVQVRWDAVLDVFQDEPLKAFHDNGGQGNWVMIVEAGDI